MEALRSDLWTEAEFVERLKNVGKHRYHSFHPFNIAMHAGKLEKADLQNWIVNRFYYQTSIPQKDAAILANCPVREIRRTWIHRIQDHDGSAEGQGGIEAWLRFGEALGVPRDELIGHRHLAPAARFAVDAYVNFARTQPWPIAVASSLTEMFAPDHMKDRVLALQEHYPWIPEWGFDYFRKRIVQAKVDSGEALAITVRYCDTPELQQAAVEALDFKCDVLWSLLDAVQSADGQDYP